MATLNNVKFLSLPQQVEQNRKNIEYLETMYNQIFTTQLAIQGQTSILIANLTNIQHKPVVGDILYGSDAYYAQITRVGESVVEFVVTGEMPTVTGPVGPQGPIGLTGPQGPQGIPGEVQLEDMPKMNLNEPDLAGKPEISSGTFRIYDQHGLTVDYETFSGNIIVNGTNTQSTGCRVTTNFDIDGEYTYTIRHMDGTKTGVISSQFYSAPNDLFNLIVTGEIHSITQTHNTRTGFINLFFGEVQTFTNYKIKVSFVKTSYVTEYARPNQVPNYLVSPTDFWFTPTLLSGATGTLRYMKDALGFVHIEGTITSQNSGLAYMQLPAGYRPRLDHTIITSKVDYSVGDATFQTSGGCYGNGHIYHIFKAV